MFLKILENYINKLTKNDIILFSNNNHIKLNNQELDYIYNIIKNNYKQLLGNNYEIIFKKSKCFIREDNLKKIYNLYIDYRSKYQSYFN